MFHDEKNAARARYQLGLIYESQGKLEEAAHLFRDSLKIISTKGAKYLGYKDGCKSCHYKEWKSWKKTKMAKAFKSLMPGVSAEIKTKYKLDPDKDYTKDPDCLICHTTGFGLPGGYPVSMKVPYKIRKAAKQTKGGTCESCHGPGSKYAPVHKEIEDKARPYTEDEFYAVGEHKVDAQICMNCHNQRSPTAGPDYHFDFEKHKDKGVHEKFKLIYRVKKKTPTGAKNTQSEQDQP